ncbi:DNA polymerase theta [Halotydeus destructor]|nr:DNA polymerase theta [Halotydeus destructor]
MSLTQKWPQVKPRSDNQIKSTLDKNSQGVSNFTSTPTLKNVKAQNRPLLADDAPYMPSPVFTQDIQNEILDHELSVGSLLPIGTQLSQSSEEDLELTNWGLPDSAVDFYLRKKVSRMFPWQRECLRQDGVLSGRNLIFSAPTSAGKTLVADILIMKQVLERKKKVLVILPYVSLSREKMSSLKEMLRDSEVRVGGFMGSHSTTGGFDATDVAICTIEKANNYLLRLLQEKRLDILGAIIVDEIHLLGDPSRGYLLELLLSKVLFVGKSLEQHIQIVGMSATLPNLDLLGKWLDAIVYQTDFRPVPLTEKIKFGNKLYRTDNMNQELTDRENSLPVVDKRFSPEKAEVEYITFLTLKTVAQGNGVLIFFNNKLGTENLASDISNTIAQIREGKKGTNSQEKINRALNEQSIADLIEQLRSCPVREDKMLSRLISNGIAYHHAGLCYEQKEIIEDGFKKNILKVIVATSTLSSGVNLPARRVIVKSPAFGHNKMMDVLTYRQMIGRAGRMGIDDEGDSILIAKKSEEELAKQLVKAELPMISSSLRLDDDSDYIPDSLQRAILEAIVTGLTSTVDEVVSFLNCTLMATALDIENHGSSRAAVAEKVLSYLSECHFVTSSQNEKTQSQQYSASQLGQGVVSSSLSPNDGIRLLQELKLARKGFVLNTDLQILYHVIPPSYAKHIKVRKATYLKLLDKFQYDTEFEPCRNVAEMLIGEHWYGNIMNFTGEYLPNQVAKYDVYRRLYVALALQDVIQEYSIDEVATKYEIGRAELQGLQERVATFSGMVSTFLSKLGWRNLELLFSNFQSRLAFGVERELIDLMRIPSMTATLARKLYKENYDAVKLIAHASETDIEKVLNTNIEFDAASPMKIRSQGNRMYIQHHQKVMTMEEISKCMVEEARELIESDVGVKINWSQSAENGQAKELFKVKSAKEHIREKKAQFKKRNIPVKNPKKLLALQSLAKIRSSEPYLAAGVTESTSMNQSESLVEDINRIEYIVPESPEFTGSQFSGGDVETVPETDENAGSLENTCAVSAEAAFETSEIPSSVNYGNESSVCAEESEPKFESEMALPSTSGTPPKKISLSPSPSKETLDGFFSTATPMRLTPTKRRLSTPATSEIPRQKMKVNRSLDESMQSVRSEFDPEELFRQAMGEEPSVAEDKATSDSDKLISGVEELKVENADSLAEFAAVLKCETKMALQFVAKNVTVTPKKRIGGASSMSRNSQISGIKYDHGRFVLIRVAININHEKTFVFEGSEHLMELSSVLKSIDLSNYQLIIFDAKSSYRKLKECLGMSEEILFKLKWFPVAVADWMLNPDAGRPKDIPYLVDRHCPNYQPLVKKNRQSIAFMTALMHPLAASLKLKLSEYSLTESFTKVEVPVQLLFAEIEFTGMPVDLNAVSEKKKHWARMRKHLAETAQKMSKKPNFNLDSPKQVASVLFKDLKLLSKAAHVIDHNPIRQEAIRKEGKLPIHLSTNKKMLDKLKEFHPLPEVISHYRIINTALSKTVASLKEFSWQEGATEQYRTCGDIDTYLATGRIAMENPNLLGVQRNTTITMNEETVPISVRSLFVAPEGRKLLSADYSQLEFRILAHLAQDETLIDALNSQGDVFITVATKMYSIEASQVTDDQRQAAKAICYGLIYGKGKKSLADDLGVTEEAAGEFKDSFFASFSNVRNFIKTVQEDCKKSGSIKTISGRLRLVPDIQSREPARQSSGARVAVNSVIQGSAADLIKMAMIEIHSQTFESKMDAKLILELHDELIFDVKAEIVEEYAKLVSKCMMQVAKDLPEKLTVKMAVNVKCGQDWGHLTPYLVKVDDVIH